MAVAVGSVFAMEASAGTFSDSLTSGVNSTYWTAYGANANLYSTTQTSSGITYAWTGSSNPSYNSNIGLSLNLAALTGGGAPP